MSTERRHGSRKQPRGLGTTYSLLQSASCMRLAPPDCADAPRELAQGEAAKVIFQIQVILRDPPRAVLLVFLSLAIGAPHPPRRAHLASDRGSRPAPPQDPGSRRGGRLLQGGAIGALGGGEERGRRVARGQGQRGPPRRDARPLGGEIGATGARGAAGQRRLRLGAALGGAVGVAMPPTL